MTQPQRDMTAYGFVALAGAAFLLWIIPAWTPEYPGYGAPASLLPDLAAGFMLVLALVGLARAALADRAARREAAAAPEASPPSVRIHWSHLARFLIPCLLCMPAMSTLGFLPAGVAFLAVIQYLCGQRRPGIMALVAVLPVLAVYALMRFGLGVPLP